MYQWWVFVHLVGVFGFLIAHGVSMGVLFRLRKERDVERINGLLALSTSSTQAFYVSLVVLLAGGVLAGIQGHWFSQGWIWGGIGILVLATLGMFAMARPYYRRVRLVARAMGGGSKAVTPEQLDEILLSRRPVSIAVIGFVALGAILYLMVLKPTLGLSSGGGGGGKAASCAPSGTSLTVVAKGFAFDATCLAAPANEAFTIAFDNQDSATPHNVAIYTDSSASTALFTGDIFNGVKTVTYQVKPLSAGTYYFRCDVHHQMAGTFVVASPASPSPSGSP
jgi:plastocyanin/uncharacterized membrane protein